MKTLQKILIAGAVALKLIGAGTLTGGTITHDDTLKYLGGTTFLVGGVGYLVISRQRNY